MIYVLLVLFAIPLLLRVHQRVGTWLDTRRFPAPGMYLNRAGHRLHVHVTGKGPVVLFESGLAASSINWHHVRRQLEGEYTCVAYDRAGFAWSDAAPAQYGPEEILRDLDAVLAHVSAEEPVTIVGHSMGAWIAQAYAHRYEGRVNALVLLDPPCVADWVSPTKDEEARLARGIHLSYRGATLARWGVIRVVLKLVNPRFAKYARRFAKAASGKGEQVATRMVTEIRKLPQEHWMVIRQHWCQPKGFVSMARHLESLRPMAHLLADVRPLQVPVAVISSVRGGESQRMDHRRVAETRCGRLFDAESSGHWPQLDEPELVANAVRWTREQRVLLDR